MGRSARPLSFDYANRTGRPPDIQYAKSSSVAMMARSPAPTGSARSAQLHTLSRKAAPYAAETARPRLYGPAGFPLHFTHTIAGVGLESISGQSLPPCSRSADDHRHTRWTDAIQVFVSPAPLHSRLMLSIRTCATLPLSTSQFGHLVIISRLCLGGFSVVSTTLKHNIGLQSGCRPALRRGHGAIARLGDEYALRATTQKCRRYLELQHRARALRRSPFRRDS